MKIPRGFIKDSEGVYRRGNFVFKDNKIFRESATIEKLKENYPTMQDCIRDVLSFYSILGDKPRTTNVYIDKAGKGFKSSEKFSKNTVAVVTPDRNVFEVNTTNIGDSTDFKDLVNKDKKDLPKNAKSLKTFSSDKPKDFDKLKESSKDRKSKACKLSNKEWLSKDNLDKYSKGIIYADTGLAPDWSEDSLDKTIKRLKKEASKYNVEVISVEETPYSYFDTILKGELKNIAKFIYPGDSIQSAINECINNLEVGTEIKNLKESAEDVEKFWSQGFKIGDTIDSSGAGRVEILDLNKDADYILIKRQTGFQPFVACWAPSINEEGKLYWGQGHYFSTEEEAKEYFSSKLNESEKLNEAYSEKLGGNPEDFISDVNEILALIKTFDTNKLATKLAYQLIEDFETKCEDLITMTKDRFLSNEGE